LFVYIIVTMSDLNVEISKHTHTHTHTHIYIYCIESGILLLEVPNFTLFFRHVSLPVSPSSISPIWFRTRITGNTIENVK